MANDGEDCLLAIIKLVLLLSFISIVIDLAGYGSVFTGKYTSILPDRLGFRQIHGFMPWPNVMATTLVVFSLLLYIFDGKAVFVKIGYLLTIFTLVRAHIITTILLYTFSLKNKITKIIIIFSVVLTGIFTIPDFVKDSAQELSPENQETIYRLIYVVASWNALNDYPFFGIGINRMSNKAIWEMENFKIHTKYFLPTELFTIEMATSDTNITFLAEIGFIGICLYFIQFVYFIFLSFKVNRKKYILFLIPQVLWFYSFPSMMFSYNYGAFYWFLYGNLLALNWETKELDLKIVRDQEKNNNQVIRVVQSAGG